MAVDHSTHDQRFGMSDSSSSAIRGDVAIIGMAALFPGAADLDAYWRNILAKVDAVTDPPPEAWNPEIHYDPNSTDTDRVYCKKGGYLGPLAFFDPLANGIPPVAVGGEPDQWLALQLAHDALLDAGYPQLEDQVRLRTSVVLGKGAYLNTGNLSMVQHGLVISQTLEILKRLHPEYTADDLEVLRHALKQALPPVGPETVSGLIPNVIVGRIANRLDLMGPTYTVDAACASSLIATQLAMRDLLTGECDLALLGGSQVSTPVPILNVFCQLGALSHREQIRPFDKDADGTLLGEGIGMMVLKRLDDAERDGDRIYAVIKGVGVASDGRGVSVMAPRIDGEELALKRAYDAAGISPETVGLVEAHGTGTPVGDVTEIKALARVFGGRDGVVARCAVGSVKSMISHTMPAAGVAGLIKTAMALYQSVLPPTLNCEHPNPKLELEKTPFYLNTQTRPWIHGGPEPRRAGVNAFGFGGINAHVVLEEYHPREPSSRTENSSRSSSRQFPTHVPDWDSDVCILEAESPASLLAEARELLAYLESPHAPAENTSLKNLAYSLAQDLGRCSPGACYRLAIVGTSVSDLRTKLQRAIKRLEAPQCRQIKEQSGIYYSSAPLGPQGKLAFLFPGEGAQYPNMLSDLCINFPEVREAFDEVDRIFSTHPRGYRPSDYIFPPPLVSDAEKQWAETRMWQMDGAIEAVITANHALSLLLTGLKVTPDVIVGHSTGEYSAMRAAGILDLDNQVKLEHFARQLNEGYTDASSNSGVPKAAMLAVGAPRERVEAIAREAGGQVYVAMDNCLHQAVLVGPTEDVQRALDIVRREALIYEYLTFDRAYHTPLFAPYLEGLAQAFSKIPVYSPRVPIYSCTTGTPYPADPTEIRKLILDHWIYAVEFRRTIEALHDDGVRLFVEVGPRGNLTSFVDDILRGRQYWAVPTNVQRRSGITQVNHLVGMLAVQGINLDVGYLFTRRDAQRIDWRGNDQATNAKGSTGPRLKLKTGFPMIALGDDVVEELRRRHQTPSVDPVQPSGPETLDAAMPSEPIAPPSPLIPAATEPGEEHANTVSYDNPRSPILSENEQLDELGLVDENLEPSEASATRSAHPHLPALERMAAPFYASAVDDYLTTMDEFLSVEEQIMRAFLDGGAFPETHPTQEQRDEVNLPPSSAPISAEFPTVVADDTRMAGSDLPPQIIDVPLENEDTLRPDPRDASTDGGALSGAASPACGPDPNSLPILGQIVSIVPGRELVAERTFDPGEDLFLRDHTLGRDVSSSDPSLLGLAVMPLTMSLEIIAEAAKALEPSCLVVGLRDIRAHRWIAFDDEPQTLRVVAHRLDTNQSAVHVQLRNLTEDRHSSEPLKSPVIEAMVLLGDAYGTPPPSSIKSPMNGRASQWTPEALYRDVMFHGPSWRGVTSIEKTGDDGITARITVLPWTSFFRQIADPQFVLDPVVLDAAGQIIGFWTMEHLSHAGLIFPFQLEALDIYAPCHRTGEVLIGAASIELIGEQQVRSDIDVIDAAGRVWMRLVGWADKRFELPSSFYHLILGHADAAVSTEWTAPIAALAEAPATCRMAAVSFASDRRFWLRVWASCVLGKTERDHFRALRTPDIRQIEWLGGRTAAKEAIRELLRSRNDVVVKHADIEITGNDRGQPVVGGAWRSQTATDAVVSIAHTGGRAVAVAHLIPPGAEEAMAERSVLVGVDLEQLRERPDGFDDIAFTDNERALFATMDSAARAEWVTRSWCAKETVAKAVGEGLVDGPASVVVDRLDTTTGEIMVKLGENLAAAYPSLATTQLVAHTMRHDDLVVATTLCIVGSHTDGNDLSSYPRRRA